MIALREWDASNVDWTLLSMIARLKYTILPVSDQEIIGALQDSVMNTTGDRCAFLKLVRNAGKSKMSF